MPPPSSCQFPADSVKHPFPHPERPLLLPGLCSPALPSPACLPPVPRGLQPQHSCPGPGCSAQQEASYQNKGPTSHLILLWTDVLSFQEQDRSQHSPISTCVERPHDEAVGQRKASMASRPDHSLRGDMLSLLRAPLLTGSSPLPQHRDSKARHRASASLSRSLTWETQTRFKILFSNEVNCPGTV